MKNVKYGINFLLQRSKIQYVIMDCVEDRTWYRVSKNISTVVREINLPVCKEVLDNIKKQIE